MACLHRNAVELGRARARPQLVRDAARDRGPAWAGPDLRCADQGLPREAHAGGGDPGHHTRLRYTPDLRASGRRPARRPWDRAPGLPDGGVLLFLLALDMIFASPRGLRSRTVREQEEISYEHDISVFPLAIPLLAGPGAITTVLLYTQAAGTGRDRSVRRRAPRGPAHHPRRPPALAPHHATLRRDRRQRPLPRPRRPARLRRSRIDPLLVIFDQSFQ